MEGTTVSIDDEKISAGNLTIFSRNCQSLREHVHDLRGNELQKSHVLMLAETWLRDEEVVEIENFNRITKYRRPSLNRGGGVSIYQNGSDLQHNCTDCDDVYFRNNSQCRMQAKSDIGDICVTRCTLPNGQQIVMVTVHISINQNVENIIDFLHEALLAYTEGGSKLLEKSYHELSLILVGDFNINFDKDDGLRLIQFLKEKLNLDLISGRALGTTRYGTTIDAMFSRFATHVTSDVPVSYFSYYKPIVPVFNVDDTNDDVNS